MKKLDLEYLKPQTARAFRFWKIPKELTDNEAYAGLDFGAMFLYGRMLEIAGLSAKNEEQFTDKNGHLFIIYTVEKMMAEFHISRPTVVKFTKQLERYGLIEKKRQGQGKPSLIFVKDFASAKNEPENPDSKEDELQEVKDVDFKKSNNFTSGSKEIELPEVQNFNPIELNNKDLENKEPENHSFPPTARPADLEDGGMEPMEIVQDEVRSQIEYPVLCENYGEELADEVVEIIVETLCRHGPKLKVGKTTLPMDLVRKRMRSLTYEHVTYVLDNLGRAGPIRNVHHYLLALLINAPTSCNMAVQAAFNSNH